MAKSGDPGPLAGLCSYVGFTDEDSAVLRAAWPRLATRVPAVIDRFFDVALAHEPTRELLAGPADVQHLKVELGGVVAHLCTGPHDEAWAERHRALGPAHLPRRLPPHVLILGMSVLRTELQGAAHAELGDMDGPRVAAALGRVCDLELALMTAGLVQAREQQGLEALRESIVSRLPMSVILLDEAGRVTTSARASPRVFSDLEPQGKPWAEVLQPALTRAVNLEARLARARTLHREILMPRVDVVLDSGPASFRVTITPLPHPMAEVLVHVEDLTDTLASEGRATRAEQLAKLGTMAATVAHEIRNPLAGVSATVQVVASTLAADDARRTALGKVQEQVQRLGNLVGDLLSLSKPITMNPRELDLAALARSVADSDLGTVEVVGAGAAQADASLLTQALFNLLQNAWQAGARTVRVEVAGPSLRVVDDGPGIPADLRDRIFEPFFTTKTRGTGLGLPTARKIVEAMGGTLRLCETSLGGACFEVNLQPHGP